jgi:hypothetical protein
MRAWAQSVAVVVAVWCGAALADEPKVAVQADVVFASTKPGDVEPSLKHMQDTLAAKVRYLTLKRLSTQRLELQNKPTALTLPNQKVAELKLEALKAGVATVHVKIPPSDSSSNLGREKSLYLQAGPHDGGDLWLVLSQPK